jgi:hypothetical protein
VSELSLINVEKRIHNIRGMQVMLDSDLAEMYGVEVRRINEQVKRNPSRFPETFMFQLTEIEYENLRSQNATSSTESPDVALRSQNATLKSSPQHGGRRYLPYAFTEQGVAMLSAVLKSETAIQTSLRIMDAFVKMRQFLNDNANLFTRLDTLEKRQVSQEIKADEKFEQLFNALEAKNQTPQQGVFFEGQIFDAHVLMADLIKSAQQSIILIDNYIDETVLVLLAKRKAGVKVKLLCKEISETLKLDIKKHNAQYPGVSAQVFEQSHDRFLIIDEQTVYHIGASIKDLGKKWFAFSKMNISALEMLGRVKL